MALEATSKGLAVHGMQGFDYDRARKDLEIPDNFDVMAMIAIDKKRTKRPTAAPTSGKRTSKR